jgi:hypothetical protein
MVCPLKMGSRRGRIKTQKLKFDKRVVGLEFNYVQGGNTLNLTEDGRYNDLKLALDRRVELLKLAQKQETTDPYNNYDAVPKVSTSPRKSSITIK